MKLLQTLFSTKTSKPDQPSSEIVSISIEPMGQSLSNVFTVVVGRTEFRLDMSQLEQKYLDFAAQLKLKANNDQVIEINDVELDVFGLMRMYVCDDKKPSKSEMKKYAVKLLEATNEYKIHPLKQICDRYLSNSCRKAQSAIDHLIIGLANDAPMLTSASFADIDLNYRKVKDNQKWLDLVEARPTIYKELYISLYRDKQEWSNLIGMKIMAVLVVLCIIWTLVSLPSAIWSLFY